MTKLKRLCALLTVICLMAGVFVGCGGSENSGYETTSTASTAAGTTAAPKKIVEITVLAHDRGNIPSEEGTVEDNWFIKWVNENAGEKIGVNIKIMPVPNAQREQVLATRLSAGEAPDVCFSYDARMISNYSANDGLTDMKEMFENYGGNLKKAIKPEIVEQFLIEGKLTNIPGLNGTIPTATFIRKDWLDQLGLKVPENIDEFYDVLKQFKEKDPGKLGDKLMPFALQGNFYFAPEAILPAFTKEPPTGEKLLQPWFLWPEAKETVRFLNKLYNEKLMGEFIVDKDTTQIRQKIIKGELGATVNLATWPYHSSYGNLLENLQKNVPGADLMATWPWKGTDVNENYYQFFRSGPSGFMRFFIPKTSKNPEAAFKYMDFMASQEYIDVMSFGTEEGTDYKVVNGLKQLADDKAKSHIGWIQGAYYSSIGIYAEDPQQYHKYYAQQFKSDYIDKYLKETIVIGEKDTRFGTPVFSITRPEYDKNFANLNTKWEEFMTKMVVAKPGDFDRIYDESMKTLRSEGGDAILKELEALYNK